ncbi:hypothetical protein BDV12DRAFT_201656 [Aspergillus spectabilis]
MNDIRQDFPTSMMIATFAGISWCIRAEINTSLFLLFKRRRGLYFFSCTLCSCSVILQPLFTILANFCSRKAGCTFNSIVFSTPTVVLGIIAQTINPTLASANLIWDRVQLVVFFTQETALSILYILELSMARAWRGWTYRKKQVGGRNSEVSHVGVEIVRLVERARVIFMGCPIAILKTRVELQDPRQCLALLNPWLVVEHRGCLRKSSKEVDRGAVRSTNYPVMEILHTTTYEVFS